MRGHTVHFADASLNAVRVCRTASTGNGARLKVTGGYRDCNLSVGGTSRGHMATLRLQRRLSVSRGCGPTGLNRRRRSKMLENLYAVRGAVLAHLIGSGRSRAVWICPWRAPHDPRLNSGISIDLRSRLYLARSHMMEVAMRSREIQPRSQIDPDA